MHLSNPCIYIKIKIKTFLVVVEERTFLKERKPSTRFFQGTPSAWEVGSFQHHSTLCFKTAYLTPFPCKKKTKTQWLAPPCCYTTSQAQAQAQAHSEASSSSSPQPQLSQPLSSFSSTYPPPLTSSPIIIHLTHPFQASILHLGLQLSLPVLAKPSLFHFTIIPKHPFNFKSPKLFIWEKEDLEVNALQNLHSPQMVMVCQFWFFLLLGRSYLSDSISIVCVFFLMGFV